MSRRALNYVDRVCDMQSLVDTSNNCRKKTNHNKNNHVVGMMALKSFRWRCGTMRSCGSFKANWLWRSCMFLRSNRITYNHLMVLLTANRRNYSLNFATAMFWKLCQPVWHAGYARWVWFTWICLKFQLIVVLFQYPSDTYSQNLDALHDHLGTLYPGMRAPSFRCTEEQDGSLILHYYSERPGLEHIVIGIVKVSSSIFHFSKSQLRYDFCWPRHCFRGRNESAINNSVCSLIVSCWLIITCFVSPFN